MSEFHHLGCGCVCNDRLRDDQMKRPFELVAEIQRLEDQIKRLQDVGFHDQLELDRLKGLANEMADKFDEVQREFDSIDQSIWRAYDVPELVQRAREAAK